MSEPIESEPVDLVADCDECYCCREYVCDRGLCDDTGCPCTEG
jgi:hypothetical protein